MKTKARTSIKNKTNSNKNNKSQIVNINKKNFCIFSRRRERNEGRNEKKTPKPRRWSNMGTHHQLKKPYWAVPNATIKGGV